MSLLWLAMAGALGALARFGLGSLGQQWLGFPYGTLIVNIVGCFAAGVFSGVWTGSPQVRVLVMTGFLGAFTTLSALMIESLTLISDGQVLKAGLYLFGTVFIGLLAAAGGIALGRML
jgi:CrcB protein